MSGYPDDRFDGAPPPPPNPRDLETASVAVQAPAVLLLITGVLSLIGAIWGLIQLPDVPAQMDNSIAQIEADPKIPREQKDAWKDIFTSVKETAERPVAMVPYILNIVSALIVCLGAMKMMNLSGRGLPIAGSVLSMIPCTIGCCCVLGLPAGIWALFVLARPDVKAAIAARGSRSSHDPDAHYLR